ncbi:subunit Stt3 of dolichyl-diphosphooligosaccharide--protein glycosyltransferase [Hamiltosporidium tvaerminnensis]|uniref:dolichyl-diphosphooligosaccharide--protein glycotransferase n=1 Tax=Hamiltosporidium tvaerminnensis TaxID=1176355 RepID=A0A4Q9KW63_9MICR|nr:Dolichyl-diphosphooligosaccharide--protein glycosyltransferase subunit stt3a [Hamiltosporidium tvaerminnensis]TBT99116.1 subunit Stt3 of dolichyl-diphosphooligosaccharide--protein glycosyltransferase [Hamiltosporidium tvaerminnensis]
MNSVLKFSLLFLISILAFVIRLTGIFKYEPILQEYDPYFNYKCVKHLVKHGLLSFIRWNDMTVWIPFGRKIFNTSYPGMMICTYLLYCISNSFLFLLSHLCISPLTLCIYFPAICSIPTTFSMYMLCNTLFDRSSCSLLASFLYALCPAYISRSISGFYDYECFSMLLILLSFNFYIQLFCIKTEKTVYKCINKMHKQKKKKNENELEEYKESKEVEEIDKSKEECKAICKEEYEDKCEEEHEIEKCKAICKEESKEECEEKYKIVESKEKNKYKSMNFLTNNFKPYFNTFICFIIFYQILCFSWGGYTFVINLISLHSLALIVVGFIYTVIDRYTFKGRVKGVNTRDSYKEDVKGVNNLDSNYNGVKGVYDKNSNKEKVKGVNTKDSNIEVVKGVSTSTCKQDPLSINTCKQDPLSINTCKQDPLSNTNNHNSVLYNNTLLFIDNPKGYSEINYWVFTCYFIVSTLITYLVPFIGSKALFSQEHLFPLTVFILHQIIKGMNIRKGNKILFSVFLLSFLLIFFKKITFLIQKLFLGRGRLLDLILRKKGTSALVNSVSEHSPRSFYGFFLDFHFLILIFPLSLKKYLYEHKIGVKSIFVLLYSLVALFFSTRMLRLVLLLGPIVCITCSYYLIYLIKKCQKNLTGNISDIVKDGNKCDMSEDGNKSNMREDGNKCDIGKDGNIDDNGNISNNGNMSDINDSANTRNGYLTDMTDIGSSIFNIGSLFVLVYLLFLYCLHSVWITSNHYSVPYVILYNSRNEVMDDFRESWSFMKNNIKNENVLCWWDYGYQISVMGEVNTINDNNTCMGERIALTGKIFLSEEKEANLLCKKENIKYIYCVVGVSNWYSSDDLNKIGWIKRIVSETFGESYLSINRDTEEYKNMLLYKMSYHKMENVVGNMWDSVRRSRFDKCEIKYFRNIFNSENYLIRIYEVL